MRLSLNNNLWLEIQLLSVLQQQSSEATEILNSLNRNNVAFEANKFYPALSRLQNKQLICSNWTSNSTGSQVKKYILTCDGEAYVNKYK